MSTSHPLRLASGLALAATLAFGSVASAQDDMVGQVEQALHDDAVAAYDAVAGFLGDVEGTVTDATSGVLDTVQADLGALGDRLGGAVAMTGDAAAREYREIQHAMQDVARDIEDRLAGAVDMAGDAAAREYREIQHALHGVAGGVDDFLHDAGHTIEDLEHAALNTLQDGVHDVANAIDHVVDGFHLPF